MLVPMGGRVRRALYVAGLFLLSLSVLTAIAPAARALPLAVSLARAASIFVQASPVTPTSATPAPRDTFFDKPIQFGNDPTPAPTASPTPFKIPKHRRARVTFSLAGSANAGESITNTSRAGANGVLSNALGLQASIERRGEASDIRMSLPGSLSSRGAYLGNASFDYISARDIFSYGYFALGPLGTLPFATIERAFSLTTPLHGGGELVLFGGPAVLENERSFATTGIRVRRALRGGFASVEALNARASSGGGSVQGLIGGIATRPGRLFGTAEVGFERLRGLGDVTDGSAFAYQVRGDYAQNAADFSITRRVVTDRFVGIGGVGGRPETLTQIGMLTNVRDTNVSVQTSFDTLLISPTQGASYELRHAASLARGFGRVQAALSFADDRSINAGGTSWNGSAAQSFAFPIFGITAIETLQATRTTASATGSAASVTTGLDLLRPTPTLTFETRLSQTNQTGSGQSGKIATAVFGASRSSGKYVFGLSDTITRTQAAALDQLTNAATISFGRRLFGGVFVQAQYGRQSTRSSSSPQLNGSTSLFNVSLGAPFALGNGITGGKSDPRAPATISGTVINDGVDPLVAGSLGAGMGDILVTLDGTETQRSDVLGRFQFRFVAPGRHEIRIEPAALPRGYTADFPYLIITVAGGQSSQVTLGISAQNGAVAGRILGISATGAEIPIESVVVRLDETRIAQSGPLGNFGFGHLAAGTHTIDIVDSSLPADVQLREHTQKFTTMAGTTSAIVFRSAPLGSIAGRLIAKNAGKDVPDGPIVNAYVIASPGDRAAITSEDGSFTIDNLPSGTYSVSVDAETLPADTDALEGVRSVELHPGERIEGLLFTIGEKLRGIDFTFKGSGTEKVAALSLSVLSPHLPPGGSTTVIARSSVPQNSLVATAFGAQVQLLRAPGRDVYTGRLVVPLTAKNGASTVSVTTSGAKQATVSATLEVDRRLPLIRVETDPRRPAIGQYVRVRIRVFTEVDPGDLIVWQDGSMTTIGSLQPGRFLVFTQKITAVPYHGILRTKTLPIPITIGR